MSLVLALIEPGPYLEGEYLAFLLWWLKLQAPAAHHPLQTVFRAQGGMCSQERVGDGLEQPMFNVY